MRRIVALVVVALVLPACAHVDPSADKKVEGTRYAEPGAVHAPSARGRPPLGAPKVIGTIADHLAVPWGIAFLPDGSALVTERDTGKVLQIKGRSVHATAIRSSTDESSVPGRSRIPRQRPAVPPAKVSDTESRWRFLPRKMKSMTPRRLPIAAQDNGNGAGTISISRQAFPLCRGFARR